MSDRSDLEARTRYDPSEVEPRIAQAWLASGLFHPDAEGDPAENYSIAIPLPNVTGVLHMGHALNNSIQDCLIRYHRMRGQRTKWILGTDHAGIGTQIQVERALVVEGISREHLGREAFVERVWKWRDDYGGQIIEQLKRLGASLDYEDERFTLDEGYVRAVQKVFVDLYEKGYIYRDRYMVNWDPGMGSAVSDLEVEDREVTDTLFYVDYPLDAGSGAITIATVRPETMLADVAIAVHPNDDRYARLVGEKAILPLVSRKLKIIADEYVKPEFGTGALKITPGHDPNDFDIGRRHGLPVISVIGEDGLITGEAPERFVGMTVEQARTAVIDELREQGLIARTEPYTHEVPYSHRSGERIEPLVSLQWFMRMDELAQPAIDVVRSRTGAVLARELHAGLPQLDGEHPALVHLAAAVVGSPDPRLVPRRGAPRGDRAARGGRLGPRPGCARHLVQLGPVPVRGARLAGGDAGPRAFYPTDVLATGRDIIFLWVARMIMLGIEYRGQIPFTDVYVHSIIQAPDGRRMSKSLGTGVDPLDLIEGGPRPPGFEGGGEFPAYGADAVRWGLYAMSSAQDVRFSEERLAQGLQLTNKLWNAARLIVQSTSSIAWGIGRAERPGSADADRGRGSLDPLASGARARRDQRPDRALRLRSRGARALRLRLRRAVRLVPRAGQAAAARRRARASRPPCCTC